MKIFLLAALLISSVSMAIEDAFKSLDGDNDGLISQDEAASDPELSTQFASLDKNHDKMLNTDEFKTYFHATHSRRKQEAKK